MKGERLTSSIASSWTALALNVLVSFFLSPFVVNKLGSVYYGIWALALQFTGYLHLLDFGVRESVIRYTARYCAKGSSKQLNRMLTVAFLIYIPISLFCILVTLLCAWYAPTWFNIDSAHQGEARWAIFFVGLTIAQTFIFNVFTGILQGLNRFDIASVMSMLVTIVRTILIVGFLMLGHGIVALAAIQFAAATIGGVGLAVAARSLLKRRGMPLRWKIPTPRRGIVLGRSIFNYGFLVLVNNVAQKITFSSDAIIVGIFLPVQSVAYYAIAGSLIDYLRMLVATTGQVFSPISSKLHTLRQGDQLGAVLISGGKLTLLIALPISITFVILGDRFIALWMGAEFGGPAGQVLLVLGLAQLFSAPHYVASSVLYGISKHGIIANLRLAEAISNIVLSIVLIKSMGLVGVAYGTVIPHAVIMLGVLPVMVCRRIGLPTSFYFLGIYARPIIAALPFAAGAWLVRNSISIANLFEFFGIIGALMFIYLVGVYFVGLDSSERHAVTEQVGNKLRLARS